MLLTADEIRKYCEEMVDMRAPDGSVLRVPLVQPFSSTRLSFIEGSAYDLSLEAVYESPDEGYTLIGENERRIPNGVPINYQKFRSMAWLMPPGAAWLFQSFETLNVPAWLNAPMKSRSSLFRSFCSVTISDAQPGYRGKIVCLVVNHNKRAIEFQQGARFAYVKFQRFGPGLTDAYRGVWGTDKLETGTDGAAVRPA